MSLSVLGTKLFAVIYDGLEQVVRRINTLCIGSRAVELFCTRLNSRSQSEVTSGNAGVNHTLHTD